MNYTDTVTAGPADDTLSIDDNLTINVADPLMNSYFSSTMNSSTYPYTITTGGTGSTGLGSYYYSNTTNPLSITSTNPTPNNTLQVSGEGADVLLNGKSLKTFMEKVEERLLILQPDPAKLEKYKALKKAYENYKLIEKLINED